MQSRSSISGAVIALHEGRCIAYPTEAVWGLGCDPYNAHAVNTLLAIKQRDVKKGLILVSGSVTHFDFLLSKLDADQRHRALACWPGPITLVIPHHGLVPINVTGGRDTVAVRVSAHPSIAKITRSFGAAIVSTSANPTGKRPALSGVQVRNYFRSRVLSRDAPLCIAPGRIGKEHKPSKIIDVIDGAVIRDA